ncbi:hypothetical protein [Desulfobacula toluolica]|uniref:hypothetical protein n=1 Tax=Desulfobacula toluolica TaxID=28223 RepID=UPI00059B94E3|nr:hypothetical protein [Desulfobacula toluolica]
MKTLSEIIEICKSGGKPDVNDARMAICAMDALITFDSTHFMRMAQREMGGKKPGLFTAERNYEKHFNRVKRALSKSPLAWLGTNNNPDNPKVQKRRNISKKIFNRVQDKCSTK